MGFRFRKSFKIAPGVKFNLNKNSHSFTFGGKGVHYTINSDGKRTKSFGIPGSGLYYTETKNGKAKGNKGKTMKRRSTKNSGNGCLSVIVLLIMLSIALAAYSLFWIPAIPILIYCIVSKKFRPYRIRNTIICSIVLVTSLMVFIWLGSPSELNSITAEWGKTEFAIGDVTEVKITPNPSDAEIESLKLSTNNIADLEYKDGKAIVTFTDSGDASLFFTADGEIKSNPKTITVIDPEEEARLKAEEEERIRLEQEAQTAEQARIEQEQAAAAAAEQERIAQEQAAAQAAQEQAAQQSQDDPIVYITNTGTKYHTAGCRTLKSQIEKHLSEVRGVYEPCGVCHPPQ